MRSHPIVLRLYCFVVVVVVLDVIVFAVLYVDIVVSATSKVDLGNLVLEVEFVWGGVGWVVCKPIFMSNPTQLS